MAMFGHDFYHGTLRRYVVMFGNLFNEMQIERFDDTGTKVQTVSVPIAYGPKQRFIERALSDPTGLKPISTILPRLAFAMTAMSYAPQRKLNSTLKYKSGFNATQSEFSSVYAPVPYDLNFTLSIMTRNSEDGTQILEKIIPFFTPDFTVTMKALPAMSINLDIPIEISAISSDDTYEGDFDSNRVLTWDIDFIVKGYLFGPVTKTKYITNADVSLFEEGFTVADTIQSFTGNSNFEVSNTITS